MPSLPSLRNPFRKAPQVTPTLQVTGSTDSFTSTSTTTTGHFANFTGSSDNNVASSLGRPYNSFSTPLKGLETPQNTETKAISIQGKEEEFAGEYKLSVVNDSGVYLPPSPTEKKSFWGKRNTGKSDSPIDRTSMDEPFTIPRESCEGYRRSFDISARSPVIDASRPSLQLDGRSPRPSFQLDGRSPRPSFERLNKLSPPTKIEEITTHDDGFEEIKLDDGKPKKRGIFARFGGDSTPAAPQSRFIMPFKKDIHAETVHESELKKMPVSEKQGIPLTA